MAPTIKRDYTCAGKFPLFTTSALLADLLFLIPDG